MTRPTPAERAALGWVDGLARDLTAGRPHIHALALQGYHDRLTHRIAAVHADAALVRWAREDMAAVERLRAAVAAALDNTDPDEPGALAGFLAAVHGVLEVRR